MQTQSLEPGKLYLRLFHGRHTIDEQLDDWGFEGPTIGPLSYVQVTYMCSVRFSAAPEVMNRFFPEVMAEWRAKRYSNAVGPLCDWQLEIADDLIHYGGSYFGDWAVFVADPSPNPGGRAAGLASAASITAPAVNDDGNHDDGDDHAVPLPARALANSIFALRVPPIATAIQDAMRLQ